METGCRWYNEDRLHHIAAICPRESMGNHYRDTESVKLATVRQYIAVSKLAGEKHSIARQQLQDRLVADASCHGLDINF